MTRLIFAIPAFAAYCGTLVVAASTPAPPTAIIGAEHPVFLGRMVVTATPL